MIESMPILMFCEVRGYPSPWVAWIWKGQVLQNKTASEPTFLLIRHATIEKAGRYTCMAGNFAGIANYSFLVTVRGTYFSIKVKCLKSLFYGFYRCVCVY